MVRTNTDIFLGPDNTIECKTVIYTKECTNITVKIPFSSYKGMYVKANDHK